ncbi:aspartyl protease family protein [Jejuia spongiicola]|uniref:Aspartyl protease family protein n=1 Tax=Jejuia spongiicola TaxID=2942207 RepID=A0ABT0QB96_9FLAO|nr:aspartyl protease family protein [Jejuia spongiicola]MCL6294257.1 aspartyl protease family protein [Jejuia spongiicola]
MKKALALILLFFCLSNFSYSQGKFVVQNKKRSDKIRFKFINNLIIIPVEINGVELSFLLDTGVSKPIIFNFLNVSDTLKIKDTEKIYLRGLGEGESVEALRSKNNVFRIGDAIKLNQDLYAVYDTNLNFAPRLGVPVHGILGFDLFKDLVVEMNYSHKYIRLTESEKYRYKDCKKCERFNLEFYNNKPYINSKVKIKNKQIPVKLLIDSGGSDALWLFEDDTLGIVSNKKYFEDFLGHGLSGSVYGKRSKIDEFSLKSFVLKRANVAYPDSTSISHARKFKGRNGSLAGNILKRFNVIMDYRNALVTFKKNGYYHEKFSYNKSGIELAHNGVRFVKERENYISDNNLSNETNQNGTKIVFDARYKFSLKPAYEIVELRIDSPAYRAGLKNGDVVLSINGKPAHHYTLQEIMYMFYDDDGKRIRLKVDRDDVILNYTFQLEDFFK